MRLMIGAIGCALIAAAAHATITAGGAYGTPSSFMTIALAVGVVGGAVAVGATLREKRHTLALAILAALVVGEGYALVSTAERVVVQRETDRKSVV